MKLVAVRTLAFSFAAAVLFAGQAAAQPTAPGSICLLPNGGWCWAESRGSSGAPCVCYTSSGPVRGTYQ